jgi:ERCC4-type nuclease
LEQTLGYTVIKDTREQQGWDFCSSTSCDGMIVTALHTGDYSLRGYENKFTIERKGLLAEFAKNINQGRFEKELERLEKFEHPFIILEFTMDDLLNFPQGTGIPKKYWPQLRVTKWVILKKFLELQMKYKTKIIFAGKQGKEVASSLFKRVVEFYG